MTEAYKNDLLNFVKNKLSKNHHLDQNDNYLVNDCVDEVLNFLQIKNKIETMTEHERLQKAWDNAPRGAKTKLYFMFPKYSAQNAQHIVENGRKDESIITQLISDLKIASDALTNEIMTDNNKVQNI